jgi:moderate conductance mechanosensitive channel
VTRLRAADGELVVIPNGQVLQVTNLSSEWARATVDVPLPVEDDELGPLLLDPPAVLGMESFELGQVNLRMVARTLPGKQFEVARRPRILVAQAFQREGIGA